jgi:hypothetical protein
MDGVSNKHKFQDNSPSLPTAARMRTPLTTLLVTFLASNLLIPFISLYKTLRALSEFFLQINPSTLCSEALNPLTTGSPTSTLIRTPTSHGQTAIVRFILDSKTVLKMLRSKS